MLLVPAPLRAGCEPWSIWEGIDPKSEEYRKLKEERAQVLMDAVEVRTTKGCAPLRCLFFFREMCFRAIGRTELDFGPWAHDALFCRHSALVSPCAWGPTDRCKNGRCGVFVRVALLPRCQISPFVVFLVLRVVADQLASRRLQSCLSRANLLGCRRRCSRPSRVVWTSG